ncbi:ribose ABC transporter permease [Paenibacillus alginolyticus]|uniref:ABC transporter permease n=1 Tax=Paenibacillus alginolyticus TaxID=59839 RepID=UPI000418C04B|nr:hypothetical protein [Paenibacillus alginolyticus]MCY9665804.1 ribose ABC transporter permease [Paenibacillus alginolyticus]
MRTKNSNLAGNLSLSSSGNLVQSIYKNKMFIILIVMILGLSMASEVFLTKENLLNIIKQVSVNVILAAGVTFVIISRGIDLSVGAILAVGGVVAASIVKQDIGSTLTAVSLAVAAGGILGYINGFTISRLGVAPFIITLAMMTIARGLAYVYVDGRPIVALPKSFLFLGQGNFLSVPISIWIMMIIILLSHLILRYTIFGRYVYYIGGNEEAARVSGINVKRIKTIVYVISGLFAGLGGAILASRINSGQPQAGMSYELDAIAAVVIGGTSLNGGVGTIPGTIIGALIIGVINNGLNLLNVSPFYQMIAKGLVIAGAVILDMRSNKSSKSV